ncbi:MAG: DeoR/GlpR family DNA-binding transcription regulator [Spirosomaceae bacterium]|jgi:DeoR/GlpR family transcriptional regulator of sugar metabolism|nr:DeoR/GlpR family DNA-binding transcription regulator [Spirosomataceae bacterium]
MLKEERQRLILDKLSTDRKISFVELGQFLNVSYDSIRRDIIELEDKGLLKKVHGGAVANSYLSILGNKQNGSSNKNEELSIIYKKAQRLFDSKQIIIMDGGTTNFFLAEQLPRTLEATIITNSPPLAMALNDHPKLEVILLGGTYYKRYQITLGNEVSRALEHINADIYFMGVNGVHPDKGLTIRHYEESIIKQNMMKAAKKTVCCAIEEKLGVQESYKVCHFTQIDIMLTHLKPTDAKLTHYQKLGVDIW